MREEKKMFKFTGTEADLIENGFEVVSENNPPKNGFFPRTFYARRLDIVIYLGVMSGFEGELLENGEALNFVTKREVMKDSDIDEKAIINVVYSDFTNSKIRKFYPVLDLIQKGLVSETVDITYPMKRRP